MGLTNKEHVRKFRERLNADPVKKEEYLKKQREAYRRKKEQGQIKSIKDLGRRDQRAMRKKWKERQQASRKNRKEAQRKEVSANTEPPIVNQNIFSISSTSTQTLPFCHSSPQSTSKQKKVGRKAVRRDRAKSYRKIKNLEEQLKGKNRLLEKYKKRLQRQSNSSSQRSPMSKVKRKYQLKKNVSPSVKKALLFEDILTSATQQSYKTIQSRKVKQNVKNSYKAYLLILKKYKMYGAGLRACGFSRKACKPLIRAKTNSPGNIVRKFFLQDDVSRIANGKRQTITRGKVKAQKRLLLDTMVILWKRFLFQHPNLKLSYTTFTRYRPFYVVIPTMKDRDSCLCKVCENAKLMLDKANEMKLFDEPLKSVADIPAAVTCDAKKEECAYNVCIGCKSKKLPFNDVTDGPVSLEQWCRKKVEIQKVNVQDGTVTTTKVNRTLKDTFHIDKLTFSNDFNEHATKYKKHAFNISHQYQCFRKLKANLTEHDVIILLDFSENYNLKYATQIQSAYFGASQQQASLHTGVIYTKDYPPQSFCSISGNMQHCPQAIWEHLEPVLRFVREKYPLVRSIHFFSDGPTSQYRQKGNFWLFSTKVFDEGFHSSAWNFWEAGHGRGPADGVGAVVKRQADCLVCHGTDITTAKLLYDKLQATDIKVQLFYIQDIEISTACQVINKSLTVIPRTLSIHQLFTRVKSEVWYRDISCYCTYITADNSCTCYNLTKHSYNTDHGNNAETVTNAETVSNFSVMPVLKTTDLENKWMIVQYENVAYPGKVMSVTSESSIVVKCMAYVRHGENKFFWPKTPDMLEYNINDVVSTMGEPNKLSSGHMEIPFILWKNLFHS